MQRRDVTQFLLRILGLFLSYGIALPLAFGQGDPVFALRQAGLEENSARQDFLNRIRVAPQDALTLSAGLEEPPYGRWLRTDQDAERVRQIVEQFKARGYPSARKKGAREHGTKKTLIALKDEGYYVRFYELGVRDYFVFLWDQPGKRPLILWAQGQQVGDSEDLHLEADEVDYPALERELGLRMWRIYSGSHPYDRLKQLQVWLGQMPLAGAVALATAKDFEAAKKAYDDYIAGGVPVVAAYALATAGDRVAAKKAYDDYIVGGVPPAAATALAVAGDRAAAKKAYDGLIAQGVSVSEAYIRAVSNHSAGLEEARVLRDRINLLPAVQMEQNSVGVIAGPEDERGWAYGVALLKRSRTATQGIVPVVFLVENEAEMEVLRSLGVSPEIVFRIGSAEYPTREAAIREATNYLRSGLDMGQIIPLGVSEKISPLVEQVLLDLFGIRLDANAAVQWQEVIDAVVYTLQQA